MPFYRLIHEVYSISVKKEFAKMPLLARSFSVESSFLRCMRGKLFLLIAGWMATVVFFACNNPTKGNPPFSKTEHIRYLDTTEVKGYQEQLAAFFDSLLLRSGTFSGGILVAKNDQILYENYVGFSDGDKTEVITPDTRFHVASTSKTFTSIAVMQLVAHGKINLDDSIQVYFPLFPYKGITVRRLLSHSSGLPNYANLFPYYKWDEKKTATNTDVLHLFYANRPGLEFIPGSRFHYSNTNFAFLALIVEKASGRFFPDYVQDSIFSRAGMMHSYVLNHRNPGAYIPSWAGNRIYDFNFLDAIYGDKNVFTTCRDLMKYDSAIRVGALLPSAWLDSSWTPSFVDRKYNDPIEHYGLGWRLKIFGDSLKVPYHNGWWHGNNAVFQRLVADTAVIIVTGNRFTNRIYSAAKAANIFRPYYSDFRDEQEVEQGQSGRKESVATKRKTSVPSRSRKGRR
jgi:CubicO group peptidase (beta-lactamase class C family)